MKTTNKGNWRQWRSVIWSTPSSEFTKRSTDLRLSLTNQIGMQNKVIIIYGLTILTFLFFSAFFPFCCFCCFCCFFFFFLKEMTVGEEGWAGHGWRRWPAGARRDSELSSPIARSVREPKKAGDSESKRRESKRSPEGTAASVCRKHAVACQSRFE